MKKQWCVLCACVLVTCAGSAYQDYPQQIGDLVFRDSDGQIYGRDGIGFSLATSHPGHVGIYIAARF